MLNPIVATLICIVPSLLLIRAIERRAEGLAGAPLSWWRRILIPLPIVFFLAANIDGILSWGSYVQSHPGEVAGRYPENKDWSADRFYYAGFLCMVFLPFILAPAPWQGFRLVPVMWVGHALWMIFPFFPLLLATGFPLRQ